jgi:hypothetical protein
VTRRQFLLAVPALLLALLVALLLTAPARLVPLLLDGQPLQLSGLSGSAWRGTAARAVLLTTAGPLHLGRVEWRLEPLSLVALAPRVAVQSQWGQQRLAARVQRRGDGLALRDIELRIDARLARELAPVDLRGRLEADLARLEFDRQRVVFAEGRAVWRDAAWQSPGGLRPLGTYVADVATAASGDIEALVDTLEGPVRAGGTAALSGDRYAIDARIGPADTMDSELRHALSLIAVAEENGYLLRLDGALAAPQ